MINRRSSFVVRDSLLVIGSALLLIFSFPGFNIWLFAWIGLVPLFFAVENQKPFKAFIISYLTGFLFFLGTIYWLIHVTLPGMLVMVVYLALYFGLFGLIINYEFSARRAGLNLPYGIMRLFLIPAAWVTLEWLRSHALTGFGWALLGYSQSFNLPIIQIADIFGVYGVSFLILTFNTAVFLAIRNFKNTKSSVIPLIVTGILILIALGYGTFRLNNVFTGEKLKVALVQGNIPQDKKWDRRFTDSIIAKYDFLTRNAAREKVDLVIWPETSVPGFLESEKDLFEKVNPIVVDINTPLLVGAPRYEDTNKGTFYYNSAFLFLKDGSIWGHYDKIHLVPFGEYVPLKDMLFFVHRFAPRPIGDYTGGKDFTVFRFFVERAGRVKDFNLKFIKNVGFSCLICFEDIFPDLAREFVRKGANFLVNITNDAWFARSSAAYQHAQASVFRAVENRINVLRAANTGLSCFIDQKGRITGKVASGGKDLFVDGFKTHEIILSRTRTIYTVYGDIFAYICLFFTVWRAVKFLRIRRAGVLIFLFIALLSGGCDQNQYQIVTGSDGALYRFNKKTGEMSMVMGDKKVVHLSGEDSLEKPINWNESRYPGKDLKVKLETVWRENKLCYRFSVYPYKSLERMFAKKKKDYVYSLMKPTFNIELVDKNSFLVKEIKINLWNMTKISGDDGASEQELVMNSQIDCTRESYKSIGGYNIKWLLDPDLIEDEKENYIKSSAIRSERR